MLNRRSLAARVAELTEQSQIAGASIGLIVCDLDHFKDVNDAHGHTVGDAVLVDVAYALRKELRAFDMAYRLGGEEFLVLMPGAGPDEAAEVAERLRMAVGAFPAGGVDVTMSFGVASSRGGRFDYAQLFAAADAALYEAKKAGRNRVVVAAERTAALV
jgi:diguanylate cyclase (GGDEF)-like protein